MGNGIPKRNLAGTPRAFRPSRRDLAIAGALFAAALAWFSLGLDRTFHPRDEAYLLRQSARVAAGEIPHRDFVDVYGPATFAVTGAVMRVFGDQVLPVRFFLAAVKAAAVASGYLLTRALATRSFAVFGALLAIGFWGRIIWNLNAPYASLYTIALTPAAFALLIASEIRRSTAGLVAAGVAAGVMILFKQSLAVFLVYGMALTLWGTAMLSAIPGRNSKRETSITLIAWALAGLFPLLPVLGFLRAPDYALHLLPIHALMALVAAAAVRRGGTGSLTAIITTRLLPFGAGAAGLLLLVVALYASWGAAGVLIDDMFVLPLTLENYAVPVALPPLALALASSGLVAAVAAGLLGLAGRGRVAVGLTVVAGLGLVGGIAQAGSSPLGWGFQGPQQLRGVQPAVLAWAGLATLAPLLLGGRSLERPATVAWLALALLHACMAFQGFPRAGPDLYVAQGVQMLLLAVLLSTWHQRISAGTTRRAPRIAAALLLAVVPLWWVLPPVTDVLRGLLTPEAFRELRFPQTEGIWLRRAAIERRGIGDLERVSARLAAEPGTAPLLLLSNEEMILFASGRQPLLPRRRAHLFWIGWGLGSRRGQQDLEAEILRRLEASPATLAVDANDSSTRRLRRQLPAVSAYLDEHYRVREQVGRYRILARAPGDAGATRGRIVEPSGDSAARDAPAPAGPPNVLLISLDTTRKDRLSCYGYPKKTTPNLDALAAEGLLFTNGIAASNWTLPTHASMLTGLYPSAHGARYVTRDVPHVTPRKPTGVMSPACVSLAEILREEGYRTAAIVANSWNLHPRYKVNQGFDHFDNRPGQPPTRYRRAAEITDAALTWLGEKPGAPFFLLLNYMDPHIPYLPPSPFRERFRPAGSTPPGFGTRMSFAKRQGRTFSGEDPLTAQERSFFSGWYDGEIAYMDSQIGRLLDRMRQLGLYDDTLVIVTGDHGEALGEHGLAGHSLTLYQPEVAVPMIVRLPRGKRHGRMEYPVHHVDVTPTVLEVLGIGAPGRIDGVSMLAPSSRDLIVEKYPSQEQAAFPRLYRNQFALYRGALKYIEYSDGDYALYDLASDAGEQHDLAPQADDTVQALREALGVWRSSVVPLAAGEPESQPLSEEELEQLRALGYVQ